MISLTLHFVEKAIFDKILSSFPLTGKAAPQDFHQVDSDLMKIMTLLRLFLLLLLLIVAFWIYFIGATICTYQEDDRSPICIFIYTNLHILVSGVLDELT